MSGFSDSFSLGIGGFSGGSGPTPPPTDIGVIPSGGIPATLSVKGRTRLHRAEDRRKFGIEDKYLEVIERVAERQVETLEVDEQKKFEELYRELHLRNIAWQGRYLEALNSMREEMIRQEISDRIQRKLRQDDEEMVLLLLAASI